MLVKELDRGMIVWKGNTVLGITGATLPEKYNSYEVEKIPGNFFDWELKPKKAQK